MIKQHVHTVVDIMVVLFNCAICDSTTVLSLGSDANSMRRTFTSDYDYGLFI